MGDVAMPFPSAAMRAWCQNIENLREAMFRLGNAWEDGWCQCQIGEAISGFCPSDKQAQLCSGLFWSVWIDQVLHSVSERAFYEEKFRPVYRFPKLYSHTSTGHASPAFLLTSEDRRWMYAKPGESVLLEDKREFWGEVSAWLRESGQGHLCEAVEAEFRADLSQRFPNDFGFLIPG